METKKTERLCKSRCKNVAITEHVQVFQPFTGNSNISLRVKYYDSKKTEVGKLELYFYAHNFLFNIEKRKIVGERMKE